MHELVDGQSVAVFGASGFVGSAVCKALETRGVRVVRIATPRMDGAPLEGDRRGKFVAAEGERLSELLAVTTVVNAAGLSDAGFSDARTIRTANALVPEVLAHAAALRGLRFVQVSSAAVQGRRGRLDETASRAPFSAYSRSKAEGEVCALRRNARTVCYRPPGVHAPERSITRSIARLARSSMSTVAAPGTANTPQALLENVADAVAFLATTAQDPPSIVSHPAEGLTTASLLRLLGGREPRRVPRILASAVTSSAFVAAKANSRLAATARRLELLWFGQDQADGWLPRNGWTPVAKTERWAEIGRLLADDHRNEDKE